LNNKREKLITQANLAAFQEPEIRIRQLPNGGLAYNTSFSLEMTIMMCRNIADDALSRIVANQVKVELLKRNGGIVGIDGKPMVTVETVNNKGNGGVVKNADD